MFVLFNVDHLLQGNPMESSKSCLFSGKKLNPPPRNPLNTIEEFALKSDIN